MKSFALLGGAALMLATGCSDTIESETQITDKKVQDFSLKDENATSSSHGQQVSPRDFLGQGSAWYFGHSN